MNITTCNTPAEAANFKGQPITLELTDGTTVTGEFLSINSKGWNVIVDGVTVSRSIARVTSAVLNIAPVTVADYNDDEEMNENDDIETAAAEDGIANLDLPGDVNDALVAELDGATTADLAGVFGIAAKELRVHLRALGMGVGKGRRYHLTSDQIGTVRAALTATA